MMRDQKLTYGRVTQVLHGLIALMIIVMLISGYTFDFLPKSTFKASLKDFHKSLGLTILCLMLIRVGWRIWNPWPALPVHLPKWQHYAARSVHLILYGLGIIFPASGWIMSVAAQHTPIWFGWVTMNLPIEPSKALASAAYTTHVWLGWLCLGCLSLHITAALKEGFGPKAILWRIWPHASLKKVPLSQQQNTF